MKRQFWFTFQQRDLLRRSLERWERSLLPNTEGYRTPDQRAAGDYTRDRIKEMLEYLAESVTPDTP